MEGIGTSLEPLLKKAPMLKVRVDGNRQIYTSAQPLPLPGIEPVIILEGSTLYVASSPAFLDECLKQTGGLAQTAEFKEALGHVGTTGNGLVYCAPKFFTRLHDLEKLNANLPKENQQVLQMVMRNVPQPKRALVTVRTNLPEGILSVPIGTARSSRTSPHWPSTIRSRSA